MSVSFNDAFGEGHEELQEAVVECQDQITILYQILQVCILPRYKFNPHLSLLLIKPFLSPQPIILKLFIKPPNLVPQHSIIVICNLSLIHKFFELLFRNHYITLGMGSKKQDLMDILWDYVATLNKEELTFFEQIVTEERVLLLMIIPQIFQHLFEKQYLLLKISQFLIRIPRPILINHTSPKTILNKHWSPIHTIQSLPRIRCISRITYHKLVFSYLGGCRSLSQEKEIILLRLSLKLFF